MILFGNKSVEFVLNTMTGIKYSVNSLGDVDRLYDLSKNEEAFKEINSFSYSQNIFQNETVKAYLNIKKCQFIDYAPKAFYNIRKLYKINNDDYLKSLGHENFLVKYIIYLIYNRGI